MEKLHNKEKKRCGAEKICPHRGSVGLVHSIYIKTAGELPRRFSHKRLAAAATVVVAASAAVVSAAVVATAVIAAATAVVAEGVVSTAASAGEEKNKDYDPAAVVTKHIGFLLV